MPADEVTHGTDVDGARERTRARHAAPKKPLFTRFHMPAGKAIASVAMPTAVLVGLGFTSSLALADNGGGGTATANSQKASDYKDCVAALDGSKDASASPSPSESPSADKATPSPSASASADAKDTTGAKDTGAKDTKDSGTTSSSGTGSGSGDTATPEPTATSGSSDSAGTSTPAPSASKNSGGLLGAVGDTLGGLLGGGSTSSGTSASPSPSASSSGTSATSSPDASASPGKTGGTLTDTVGKVTDTVGKTAGKVTDTVKDTTDGVSKTVQDTTGAVTGAASAATSGASAGAVPDNCEQATDDVSGVDNKVPVADDPWYLNASSLLLKGADYQGIVEVKTANGSTKKVLKYVISGGTDIGDLHQTVKDKLSGKTYHVQAAAGSTSTIRDGDTVFYTESISGNLFGLVPLTFSPDSPPPLNLPLIYFTNVKVVQAAQFGGNLHVPGMHVYTTDN
ncbi:hypothetical protein ACGFYV_22160 [Streptomyces sp. NPDC048297]|uniref:hypothetical protein n=1 Tax=Streptomyces sp. NPDC048297 TaxID=3365531 RepID=UPI00370FC834